MIKAISSLLFILMSCGFTFAQDFRVEFAKIRMIRVLESTRDDVKKILAGYKSDKENETDKKPIFYETFSSKIVEVKINYTGENCSDEGVWNLPADKVEYIEIIPEENIKFTDIEREFSNLRKEQMYVNDNGRFVYHNKNLGIAFHVDEGEIEKIRFLPTISFYSKLCEDEENEEIANFKEYINSESYFLEPKLEKRVYVIHAPPPSIETIKLDKNVIILGCTFEERAKNHENKLWQIAVTTDATDSKNDVLTYVYKVSAGKIIGKGAKVIWDLSEASLGKHTITVGVDDGCGVCSETVTKEVVVKECSETPKE